MMKTALVILTVALFCAVESQDTTPVTTRHHHHSHHTHPPHTTADSSEKDKYSFTYDGHTHAFVIKHESMCYLVHLSDKQIALVHDPAHLASFEAHALKLVADPNAHHTAVDKNTLDAHIVKACHGATTIERLSKH